jgi:hypothetical protein
VAREQGCDGELMAITVTFDNEIKSSAAPTLAHPLDIMGRPSALHPWKKIARLCCGQAHLVVCEGQERAAVTCCHAGHPSFMICDCKVVGTAA